MKQLTCEMCGGTDLMKQDGAFVCQNCGMKYSVEEAKKMMIEIDNTKKLTNLHLRAENAIKVNDYKLAIKCYNQILEEDPNDWKAYFYSYFLDFDKKTAERYYTQLGQILPITYEMAIKNCSTDEANSRVTAITEIFSSELMADIKSNKAWLRELDNIEPKLVLKLEKIKEREERYRNRREIVRDKTVYIDYVFRSAENKLEDFLINNKIEESVCKKCLLIIRQDKYQITSMSFSPEYSSPDYFLVMSIELNARKSSMNLIQLLKYRQIAIQIATLVAVVMLQPVYMALMTVRRFGLFVAIVIIHLQRLGMAEHL